MKRLTLLAIALIMVLGMAVSASAAPEVKISGNLLINTIWKGNWDFDKDAGEKAMEIRERADLYFTVTANENLKGVLGFRSVKANWGQGGFALDGAGGGATNTIDIRDAYIDFNWPGTDVNIKAGLYPVVLPQAVGGSSMIIGERAGAVMVSAPVTDNVSVLAGYTRLYDYDPTGNNANSTALFDESYVDGYVLALPLSFEGVSAAPYFLYAYLGQNALDNYLNDITGGVSAVGTFSGEDAKMWWLGTSFNMSMFDPFIVRADLAYGKATSDNDTLDQSGWMFDVALDYTGFDFMTVTGYFAYTSGDDDDDVALGKGESMPILNSDWAVGSFFFGGGSITSDDINGGDIETGFWVVGLDLADIQSFAQGLTHTVHVLYAKGTNDETAANVTKTYATGLTEKDSLWEVDFNTDYAIYDELTLYTQIGYINADFDESVWNVNTEDDAWKFATGVVYKF